MNLNCSRNSGNQSSKVSIANIFIPFLNTKVLGKNQTRINVGSELFSSSVYYSTFNSLVKEVAENIISCQMFTTTSQSITTIQKLTTSSISKLQGKVFLFALLFSRGQLPNMTALHLIIIILLKSRVSGESV